MLPAAMTISEAASLVTFGSSVPSLVLLHFKT